MSLAIPMTNGHLSADALQFGMGGGMSAGAGPAPEGASAADVQGTGSLMGAHNTPLHVATVVLFAGGLIIGLHFLGFRFGFDVGLGR
jgi:hypothetical protein